MSNRGRSNLQYNGRGASQNWFQNGQYLFQSQQEWHTSEDYVSEYFDLPTINTSLAYGDVIRFETDARADILGKQELILRRGALSGGTDPYFNDFEAFSSIEKVEWWYNNKLFHKVTGEELMIDTLNMKHPEERQAIAYLQAGDRSISERQQLAASSYTWVCDLQVPWDHYQKQIHKHALANKMLIEVTMNPLSKCTVAFKSKLYHRKGCIAILVYTFA